MINKHIFTKKIILIILAVAVVLFGGVYTYSWYVNSKLQDTNYKQIQNSNTQNSETAGWKTYTNIEYGFELEYPPYLITKKVLINRNSALLEIDFVNGQTGTTEEPFYLRVYSGEVVNTMSAGKSNGVVNFKNTKENLLIQISYNVFFDRNELNQIVATFKFTK